MPDFNRHRLHRDVLTSIAALILGIAWPAAGEPVVSVKIQADLKAGVSRIAPDFMGLGYETSAVAQSNYSGHGQPAAAPGR